MSISSPLDLMDLHFKLSEMLGNVDGSLGSSGGLGHHVSFEKFAWPNLNEAGLIQLSLLHLCSLHLIKQ